MADLTRDPASWARDWGWISRRRAVNLAAKINEVVRVMEGALGAEDCEIWTDELRAIAKQLAPAQVPAQRRRARQAAS